MSRRLFTAAAVASILLLAACSAATPSPPDPVSETPTPISGPCPEGFVDDYSQAISAQASEVDASEVQPSTDRVDLAGACIVSASVAGSDTFWAFVPAADPQARQAELVAEFTATGYGNLSGNGQYAPPAGTGYVEFASVSEEEAADSPYEAFGAGFAFLTFSPGA